MSIQRKADSKIIHRLKSQLPRGYSNVLAEKARCSRQYVSQVINTGNMAHPIWDMAIALQKQETKRVQKKKEKTWEMLTT